MATRTRRPGAATGAAVGSRRRRLPMRLLLPVLFLAALMAMLMLRGYVHSEILADHRVQTESSADQVPEEIVKGGPVIDTRTGRTTSLKLPDGHMVLTFDDGPDPTWTPKVLDVLKKHKAHAVFFVTGTMTSRYPDLVRRMVDEGHEIGLHTFNHPDLSLQSKERIDWELSQNQLAITGAAADPHLAVPAAVLLVRLLHGQQLLAGHPVHRHPRLHHRRHQRRQPGLAQARRRPDHPQRHAQGRQGRGRPDARLRRRPPPDGRGAGPVPAADEGQGLRVRQPHRGPRRPQRAHPGGRLSTCGRARRGSSSSRPRTTSRPSWWSASRSSASWSSPASA